MAKSRTKRPDDFTAPFLVGNQTAEGIYQALRPLDKIAHDMEMKWGVGRLQEWLTPEEALKFGSAKAKLDQAIINNIPDEVAKRAAVMIRGWQAIEKKAIANGHEIMTAHIWSVRDDSGEVAYAFTRDTAEAHAVADELEGVKVYSLAEVVRIIEMFEAKNSIVSQAKEMFPHATVSKITGTEYLNDELPF
jgi:hypothetical protein